MLNEGISWHPLPEENKHPNVYVSFDLGGCRSEISSHHITSLVYEHNLEYTGRPQKVYACSTSHLLYFEVHHLVVIRLLSQNSETSALIYQSIISSI